MTNQIGRYELQLELGRGGFGRVYRAWDPRVGRQVAIKTLHAGGGPDLLKRFRNEAVAAGKLRHPNIVTIHDFGVHDGSPYLVMELLEGEDLERLIEAGTLPLAQRLSVMIQAARGLHHAHTHGIVHRDVKPANIMLLRDGTVKILDFGIALLTQATASRLTPQGSLIGTVNYMAPEQFDGLPSDSLTDIFAFGASCYKLLTGTHPFQAAEISQLMFNIIRNSPQPLRTLNAECSQPLEQIVLRMLSKEREARYQNLEDVTLDLEQILQELQHDRVEDLLLKARERQRNSDVDAALLMVKQAIDIERGNRAARDLREELQQQIRERTVRPQVEARIQAGRESLQSRNFGKAILDFDSALRLDPSNRDLQTLIQQAKAAKEKGDQANLLFERARDLFQRGELAEALTSVSDALMVDPAHPESEVLRQQIAERIAARNRELQQRERSIREAIAKSQAEMATKLFDRALIPIEDAIREYGPVEELQHAKEAALRAQAQEEDQRQELIRLIEDLLAQGKAETALRRLDESPADARFASLRARCQCDLLLQRARALATDDLERALSVVMEARRLYGATAPALALTSELERRIAERDWHIGRSRALARLVSIEAGVATESRTEQLASFSDEARQAASRYGGDAEVLAVVTRVERRIAGVLESQAASRKIPWTKVAVGCAAVITVASLVIFILRSPRPRAEPLLTIPVHTDPEGASITLNGKSCITPNCSFTLKPGRYEIKARLDGFKTSATTLAINATGPSVVNLRLEPLPSPPLPTSPSNAGPGTLAVSASLPDALVFIDNTALGRTDAKGVFQTALQPATYRIRVQKAGYQVPSERQVTIATGVLQRIDFTLVPRLATLVVRGAPAGVELRTGARLLGRTDGSPLFSASVTPGDQVLRVNLGLASRQVPVGLKPDDTLTLAWPEIAPQNSTKQTINTEPLQAPGPDFDSFIERQDLLSTLAKLSEAIQHKDEAALKAIWPSIPASRLERWRTDFYNARSIQYELRPQNRPEVNGNTSTIKCDLTETKVFDTGDPWVSSSAVYIVLRKSGDTWVVQSIR